METGIYILATSDGYRVAYSNLYTDLYSGYSDETRDYIINVPILLTMFNNCALITDVDSAYKEALNISRTVKETDNGIMVLNYQKQPFEELVNATEEKIIT